MKLLTILFLSNLLLINCKAQNQYNTIDNLESSFVRIDHDMRIPCQFEAKFNKRENGIPFFTTNDSTQLEFAFFKISSLPFYDSTQNNADIIRSYYDWFLQKKDATAGIKLNKVNDDKNTDYSIYKIVDALGEFYRLFAINRDILLSIKILGNKTTTEDQLDKLQILYTLNKKL